MTALACWCGAPALEAYSPDYRRCPACGTLVTAHEPPPDVDRVRDDTRDLYGRDYWFQHQADDLNQPTIAERVRTDMPERCAHWLRALLRHRLPPGRVLELGAAHGGFVALLRQAGFEATGLELSPAIVELARSTFDVPMLTGRLEEQDLPDRSLDVIALFDVLEHLPAPVETLRHCARLLAPGGMLLVQTPRVPPSASFAELDARQDPFLVQFKRDEHLFLLTEEGARQLFAGAGMPHLAFAPAIFAHYDMFFAASPEPLERHDDDAVAAVLRSPGQRVVLALLDLADRYAAAGAYVAEIERDRADRLRVIQGLDDQLRAVRRRD